jgi:hypothetical protein
MNISTTLIRRAGLVAGLVAAAGMTGCAGYGVNKQTAVEVHKQDTWYVRVLAIASDAPSLASKSSGALMRNAQSKFCTDVGARSDNADLDKFCRNPDKWQLASGFPMFSQTLQLAIFTVLPLDIKVDNGDVLQVGPVKHGQSWLFTPGRFVRVAASDGGREGCGWSGPPLRLTVGPLHSGVVCDGWDYRETFLFRNNPNGIVRGSNAPIDGAPQPWLAPVPGPDQTGWKGGRLPNPPANSRGADDPR